ncbi:MAG: flagellar basal-body MS-ring/collar protein FliF [Clostridium sp.]|uniref:flagellar basal-body MS-ring/collar protein FliF n=1 Tax=Clostridium sp. TaxID=1506 RepID=UPI003F32197A
MEKLKEIFKGLWGKFKSLGKGVKIALIIALISIVMAMVMLIFYNSANKYKVLFKDLDPTDAQIVTSQLKENKIDMKVDGSSILVPKDQVDSLRLELAPNLSSGSKGYELMDDSGSFGMTDEEFNLKKQRMLQGELERTIKSFPQVNEARIHITEAKDSVFVEDKEPGKAAVILNVNGKLELEQVKSIVSLVSGSTVNIPKENVEVIDQSMNLLSQGIDYENGASSNSASGLDTQFNKEKEYEGKLQKEIVELLEPVVGKGKIRATVNADLDFDSKQKTETNIDPNKVIVSQQTISENNNVNNGANSQGPVDNNMSNTIGDNKGNTGSNRNEQNTNYESGRTEIKTISAPGEVKRLTASVIVDGNLSPVVIDSLRRSVENAIGLNTERGDKISLESMEFDPSLKAEREKALEELNAQMKRDKIKGYVMLALGIIALIVIVILLIKFIKRRNEEKEERRLDVVVGANDYKDMEANFKPVDFGNENEKVHLEKEVKNYAKEKPDQVVDVIKSWLSENEG